MNRDVIIAAPLIQEIKDGHVVIGDAYFFNPKKVVWMKSRDIDDDFSKPYTIIKLEGTEPFKCVGDIEQYVNAMGMGVHRIYAWDTCEDDEEEE